MKTKLCVISSAFLGLNKVCAEEKTFKKEPNLDSIINEKSAKKVQEEKLQKFINEAKNLCWLKMTESAIPGLVIAVSVDGKTVFKHGKVIFDYFVLYGKAEKN